MKVVITITGAGGDEEKPRPKAKPRAARKPKGRAFVRRLGSRKDRYARAVALSKDGGVADPKMNRKGIFGRHS